MCSSEVVIVKTDLCDYLVQVYHVGGQVSICNYKCGRLEVSSRVSSRLISITSVNKGGRESSLALTISMQEEWDVQN